MYNYSNDFHRKLGEDYRNFTIRIHMKVSDIDGNVVEFKDSTALRNQDIMENTFTVDSATSNTGELTIGAVVASQLKFTLYNDDDKFSLLDFIDGNVRLWIGMEMDDDTIEECLYGVYTITEAKFSETSIAITALDNISKLSHLYEGGIVYPTTLEGIVRECCSACGVLYDTSLPVFMKEYTVKSAPQDTSLTYAMLISYAAQAGGCFVRTTPDGKIRFDWYSMATLNDNADGGTFKYDGWTEDHQPESELDGGTFAYDDGDSYDGGTFRDLTSYHTINHTSTSTFDTDDVAITGVKVTSMPVDSSIEADTTLAGKEGYVVEINSNPLIQEGQSGVVANQIYDTVRFMIFRPLSVSTLPDPSIEAGDIGVVADPNGNYYNCFFSTVTFNTDGYMNLSCDAPSRNRQNASVQSAISAVLQKSKEWVAHEKSDREIALENMANLMSNALGFYSSEIVQESGGSILYLHNKKNLTDSNIQWKVTEQGVAVSTDYGKTFTSGWTSDGNMVANTLSAVGINADWISAGTIEGIDVKGCKLTSSDPSTNFKAVIDDGKIKFYGSNGDLSTYISYLYLGGSDVADSNVWCLPDGHSLEIAAVDGSYAGSYVRFMNPSDGYANDFTVKYFKAKIILENTSLDLKSNANGPSPLRIDGSSVLTEKDLSGYATITYVDDTKRNIMQWVNNKDYATNTRVDNVMQWVRDNFVRK